MSIGSRCVLIRIGTWIFNDHLNWDFIFWTVWVCDDDCCVFVTFSCSINWCLVFELSAFWKVADVANWILSVWLITWFDCLVLSYRCVLIRVCAWVFDSYLNWNLVFWTIWVCHNHCCIFFAFSCSINRCLVLELSTFWKVADVANWILSVWLIAWFDCLIFSHRCVLIGVCTWINHFNCYRDFIDWTIWVGHYNCCSFIARCCCIHWSLEFKLRTTWKVTNITNWVLSVWCFTNVNRLVLRCWCILICVCTRIYYSNLNWDFINWTIWISHNDSCSFIARSCCIHWCLEFELSSFWKITNIADWILCFWCFTNVNRLILRCWCVLVRICTRVYNFDSDWNFINWTIWVSHNDGCSFIARCCCIHWSLEFELSSFWKISNVTNWVFSIWLIAWFYRLIFGYRSVLIRIRTWIFDDYLNWYFIFRAIRVCHNYCRIFFAWCCCVYRCLVLELSAFW